MTGAATAQATEKKSLHGHVPPAVARLQPVGEVSGATSMRVAIGLPLHHTEELTNLLQELYNPASPVYHQYLTPERFTERFGPTPQEYQAVIDFAKANHLTVQATRSSRTVLGVEGTVADLEKAFAVKLQWYQHPKENRQFFAPDTEPSVAAELPILDVQGLSSFIVPHPRHTRSKSGSPVRVGSGPNGLGYMGADFRTAFAPGVTNTGTGQSVALVEFDGYYANDVYMYETNAGISTNIQITNVLLNSFDGSPSSGSGGDNGEEVTLDIQMVIAMAPGISRLYVYEDVFPTSSGNTVPLDEVNLELTQIASDNFAKQISCSWAMSIDGTTENTFQQFAAQGQSFFDASGDDGGDIGDIVPAADDPYITQVGGTLLTTTSAGGPWASETVWWVNDPANGIFGASSGGVSDLYPIPGWQQGVNMINNMGSATMRNFPDVAMPADNVFVVTDNGVPGTLAGTSCAAPLWAGFTALANQQAVATGKPVVGFINPAIYAIALSSGYQAAFHDITTGNNENYVNGGPCSSEFVAVSGYDLCTGLGTPTGSNLINALLAPADALQVSPNVAFTASGLVAGPFNVTAQNYSLSNSSSSSVSWSLVNPAAWLQATSTSGSLAAHATSNVTLSLSPAAFTQAAGVYTATAWFTNLTSHFGQSRQFALRVGQPIVQNGGFETADMSFWLLAGDNGGWDFGDDGTILGVSPHSGNFCLLMGFPNLPEATLIQTLPTIPGKAYQLSYYRCNPDIFGGPINNEFTVWWNGAVVSDEVNLPKTSAWSLHQFRVGATGPFSMLTIGAFNENDNFGLDDVSVVALATAPPAFQSIRVANNTITLTWSSSASQSYQVQYTTDLVQGNWNNLGSSITATGATTTSTDTPTSAPRYYRIVWLP